MRVNRHETRDGMTTFSLCMIVKDEEEVLSRCLNSLCDIMDEIIIVDTGSTDRTKEIAKKYTDKVFDYKWCNDFADARNFAASKAVGDYIYTADADEYLDNENKEKQSKENGYYHYGGGLCNLIVFCYQCKCIYTQFGVHSKGKY